MRYTSKQSLRGYDKAALGSITPTLSGVVVSDPRLPHEINESGSAESTISITSFKVGYTTITQGQHRDDVGASTVFCSGEGFMKDGEPKLVLMKNGTAVTPNLFTDTAFAYAVSDDGSDYEVLLDGEVWATFNTPLRNLSRAIGRRTNNNGFSTVTLSVRESNFLYDWIYEKYGVEDDEHIDVTEDGDYYGFLKNTETSVQIGVWLEDEGVQILFEEPGFETTFTVYTELNGVLNEMSVSHGG